jgi:hypothetical protein
MIGQSESGAMAEKPRSNGRYYRVGRDAGGKKLIRDMAVTELKELGWTYDDLADAFGLHRSNVIRSVQAVRMSFLIVGSRNAS